MSTHAVKIIEVPELKPHPNAERLEIVPVGGWQAVARKGQFKRGEKAIYIEPDYVVPTSQAAFAFVARDGRTTHRLKAVRLRGELSFGLLVEVPDALAHMPIGSDVMEALGIVRYEPPLKVSGENDLPEHLWPKVRAPKFDVENLQNHLDVFGASEDVIVTEKIDGANARYLFSDGVFYVGSRTRWLDPDKDHIWSRAVTRRPEIRAWCAAHPDTVLFGEVFGHVQSLRYGTAAGEVDVLGFAALKGDAWLGLPALRASLTDAGVPVAPVLYEGPFDLAHIKALAERDSLVSRVPQLMEGVVIVPAIERRDANIGRVALKLISNRFWESEA